MFSPQVATQYEEVDALNLDARELWHSNPDKARKLVEKAQSLARPDEASPPVYEKGWIDSLALEAQCNLATRELDKALNLALKALDFYERFGYKDVYRLNVYYVLGVVNKWLSDYVTALNWYEKLVKTAEDLGETKDLAIGLRNIGNIHLDQNNYEAALYLYNQAEPHFKKLNDAVELASIYNNYCNVLALLGDSEKAENYGKQALQLFSESSHLFGQARAYLNLATNAIYLGRLNEAEEHIKQVRDLTDLDCYSDSNIGALLLSGEIAIKRGDYKQAIDIFNVVIVRAKNLEKKLYQYKAHHAISQAYEQLADWQNALSHYKEAQKLWNEIRDEESLSKLRNFEVLHKTKELQSELERERVLRETERFRYEQLGYIKDEILNTASHDLKNPLSGIKMSLSGLRKHLQTDDARGQQLLNDVEKAINQMRDLITNVLDLAKLETLKALPRQLIDLNMLIEDLLASLQTMAEHKQLSLRVDHKAAKPLLYCHPSQLHQALYNLLSNAIKYSHEQTCVQIGLETAEGMAKIHIVDTGIGIPAYALDYIFERFYRVPDAQHQAIEGTGLGLAIAKAVIEQHEGIIEVESEVGKGTRFTVSLPIDI